MGGMNFRERSKKNCSQQLGVTYCHVKFPFKFFDKMLKDFLKIINLYRGADEFQLYHKWLKGGKLHEGIKESFIFQTYVFLKEGVKVA